MVKSAHRSQCTVYFSPLMFSLSLILLGLAIRNLWCAFSIESLPNWLFTGTGVYWLMVVGAAIGAGVLGWRMQALGSTAPPASFGNAESDKRWILRFGGRALAASGPGLMLIPLWLSQGYFLRSATSASPSEGIGFFDLMTWLGTFATFVVVVATALVAMYVKRRDDEARHSSAVMSMRQAWIDNVRSTLSELIALGQILRAKTNQTTLDMDLATKVRGMLREIELQLNPTEGHHAVLLKALDSWIHEAGIEDHIRGVVVAPSSKQTDFDAVATWLVALGQLALKIEWIVTSLNRASVEAKAGRLWDDILAYEKKYATELGNIAPEAVRFRMCRASILVEDA